MGNETVLAPVVRSILDAARERPGGEALSVDARSLDDAFSAAEADGRVPIIAEVKPTSPTTDGTADGDPATLARAMVDGGAAAISVLTESKHFGGSTEALRSVREAVEVPVLRKDFLLREDHLDAVEADLVLLIARFVEDLPGLVRAARERGFVPLVEVHDEAELADALDAGATVIGVNNRDLSALEVDLGTFERVAPELEHLCGDDRPPAEDVTLIAESGIGTKAAVERMRTVGADGLLVGSAIMGGLHGESGETPDDRVASTVRTNTRRLTTTTDG